MTPGQMARIHRAAFSRQRPWSKSEFDALLMDPAVHATTDGQGFGLIRIAGPEAELLTLAVAPDAQRKGIARNVMHALIDAAVSHGAEMLFLEVAAGNTPAIALYNSLSFQQTGRRPAYYRYPGGDSEDALVLALTLPK